jgi:hypothetical protein
MQRPGKDSSVLAIRRRGEASALHHLASIEMEKGAYPAAREKFDRMLMTFQQIGNRGNEAATLHQFATLNLREGAHQARSGEIRASSRNEAADR